MEEVTSAVYGLQQPSRYISAQLDVERNRFIVPSLDLNKENHIHLLDFDEELVEVTSTIFKHNNEIWNVTSCPNKRDLIFVCDNKVEEFKIKNNATLYRMHYQEDNDKLRSKTGTLENVLSLDCPEFNDGLKSVIWNPSDHSKIIGISDSYFCLFDLVHNGDSNLTVKSSGSPKHLTNLIQKVSSENEFSHSFKIKKGLWNPHNANQIGLCSGKDLFGYDLLSNKIVYNIESAHQLLVRDFDFNPNKPYYIASSGEDCLVRFWDIRKIEKPLKEISDHTHWITSIEFNRFHDQLFLTSSTDCQVNLQSVISVSSAAGFAIQQEENIIENEGEEEDEYSSKPVDGLVANYDQHEDSVYSVAWSGSDPWIFASLSYDEVKKAGASSLNFKYLYHLTYQRSFTVSGFVFDSQLFVQQWYMFIIGVLFAFLGCTLIGIGSTIQKYALNNLQRSQVGGVNSTPNLLRKGKIKSKNRFQDKTWLFGLFIAYFGDVFGNSFALSFVSAAIVTPMGIVAVLVQALLAQRYLGETINSEQKKGYGLIIFGVILIILAAPKGETNLGSTTAEVLNGISSPNFIFGIIFLFSLIVYLCYLIFIKKMENLAFFVSVQALFGAITVISSKILSFLMRLMALPSKSTSHENILAANKKILLSSETVGLTASSPSSTSEGSAFIVLLVACVAGCAVSGEYFKQQALSRFAVSKVGAFSYASFTCCAVLSNIVMFQEISDAKSFFIFSVFFFPAMFLVLLGIQLVHSETSEERARHSFSRRD